MQLTFEPARLTGFAILAVASATALSVGACSSSHDEKSPATSSLTGGLQRQKQRRGSRPGRVGVRQRGPGHRDQWDGHRRPQPLGEGHRVHQGSADRCGCRQLRESGCQTRPAPRWPCHGLSVTLNPPAGDGKCPQPKPAAAGSPGAPGPDQPFPAVGTVAAVEGNNIKVTDIDANGNPSQTEVTVTDKTQYTKGVPATLQAVAQGKCITARGTIDGGGTLQATMSR